MREATITRTTAETQIEVALNLDGTGVYDNQTGVGFFDHMLDQLSRHSLIDLTIRAKGDLHVDDHHTVEDTGIAIGQALTRALADKKGIRRYGSFLLAMDDSLVRAALDLSVSTASTATTSPRLPSRPWPVPCARRWNLIRAWRACCRPPRGRCDAGRADRL